jgi:uncharacterized protein YbjQ (UPF0145 family)
MTQPAQPPPLLISTMNDLPGWQVVHVFGEVFGLTVRSRNAFADMGAGFRGLVGGEVRGYTKMLSDSRWEAIGRLREEASRIGANAVLAMRFDFNEILQNMTEVAAYGTAVHVVPATAQPTTPPAPQLPQAQQPPQ